MIRFAFAALIALVLCPASAFAGTSLDLSPFAVPVFETVMTVLAGVVVWFGRKAVNTFEAKTGIQLNEQMRAGLDDALYNGIAYARERIGERLGNQMGDRLSGSLEVDVKNETLAMAADYVLKAMPETLDYFGINRQGVIDRLEARLGMDLNRDGRIGFVTSHSS
ncbi:inadl protein [Roseibium sp. TrichSKD4]|uniref:hypothetical protein n=1 Tax=Roseibium sp. TrichSKD4 TaxID=744980 RepID=UPI0001E56B99|nr:hypothetical protein [Roseibium sp. TrichSKD4]EFO32631.1 inadl protein [Roseibium sp. TrichSKD4]